MPASPTSNSEMVELVAEVDALEERMKPLRPTRLRVTARVGTYFGVLAALTVGLVDSAYVLPWMAATFVVACLPDVRRYLRYQSLVSERDLLLQRGAAYAVERTEARPDE